MLRARQAVQNLREYRPPLGDRVGLRLDFNENTLGASPRVLQCLRELTLERLARYPERESVEVALAEFFRVRPGRACFGVSFSGCYGGLEAQCSA